MHTTRHVEAFDCNLKVSLIQEVQSPQAVSLCKLDSQEFDTSRRGGRRPHHWGPPPRLSTALPWRCHPHGEGLRRNQVGKSVRSANQRVSTCQRHAPGPIGAAASLAASASAPGGHSSGLHIVTVHLPVPVTGRAGCEGSALDSLDSEVSDTGSPSLRRRVHKGQWPLVRVSS